MSDMRRGMSRNGNYSHDINILIAQKKATKEENLVNEFKNLWEDIKVRSGVLISFSLSFRGNEI